MFGGFWFLGGWKERGVSLVFFFSSLCTLLVFSLYSIRAFFHEVRDFGLVVAV